MGYQQGGRIVGADNGSHRTDFLAGGDAALLANHGCSQAQFFITENGNPGSQRIELTGVNKGAHRLTGSAAGAFLWLNNKILLHLVPVPNV